MFKNPNVTWDRLWTFSRGGWNYVPLRLAQFDNINEDIDVDDDDDYEEEEDDDDTF